MTMKLHYIVPNGHYANGSSGLDSGVGKKIQYQKSSLEQQGVNIEICELSYSVTTPVKYIASYLESHHNFKKIVDNLDNSDIVYCRSLYPHISNWLFCKKYPSIKFVYELQSVERKELKSNISSAKSILSRIIASVLYCSDVVFGKSIKKHAAGLVSVTSEITDYNIKLTNNQSRYLTLGNGIDVTMNGIRDITSLSDSEIHVLCVAQIAKWHGIDRFIRGLHEHNAHYENSTKIVLHIVGDGPELPHLKDLTNNLGLNENVIFHGFKSGKELDEMFDLCHIAIGSLAGFRPGLTELSSLKSREYCARGIPFLMASKDADFPENWEYTQMVPANETPIDMNTVVDFANRVMADPEHPQKMRRYAEEHIDWMAKMKVLKEFLESL